MTPGDHPTGPGSEESVSPATRHAQMAEGLFHRYRDIVLSMDRRESFIWDAAGTEQGNMNWMQGRGAPDDLD